MVVQPGIWPPEPPDGSTPVAEPAVRHAPLKKYQLLVVEALVKSSLTADCACSANGAATATIAATTARELLRLITNHLC
jgi:hypothetical protein